MFFKQFYLGCLAHASYLIGSDGEAAVIDPQRDVDQYVAEADSQRLKIKYVIETHLHADFVSGHRELAARTGAEIVFGQQAGATFPHRAAKDLDELQIGKVRLQIMETPGHTPESICILVTDTDDPSAMAKVMTGDTLFIGDVGRPDLASGKGYTPQSMAAMMYDSLHQKLMRLDDSVEVYPAHGAGSMCGKNLSTETSSTIGAQRKFNYALRPMSKDEFVTMMTTDLQQAPAYFSKDAEINRGGAEALSTLAKPAALTASEVNEFPKSEPNAVVLDVRNAGDFGAGHVPGSINIGLGGQFAMWAGTLIPLTAPIVLIAESDEQVEQAVIRLARIGIESVKGYLDGGVLAWVNAGFETEAVPQITVAELHELITSDPELQILDVRRSAEYQGGHVPEALSSPLGQLRENASSLRFDKSRPLAVICAGGYRSSAATSILRPLGYTNLLNVTGGTSAWVKSEYEVSV